MARALALGASCAALALGVEERREEFSFVHWPHRDSCWRVGRPRECCVFPADHPASAGCWDDFWSFDFCCGGAVSHRAVPEDDCISSEPLARPSADEPFLFLWDEKAGGSTFNRWLLESAAHEGLLKATHISDFWWPNLIGAPYFLKFFGEERRQALAVVSGSFDWRAAEGLCLPRAEGSPQEGVGTPASSLQDARVSSRLEEENPRRSRRPVRCFVLLRDPVDRFVSYWLERSDRRLERQGERTLGDVPLDELRAYLDSVRAGSLRMSGSETGVGCNREAGLCLEGGGEGGGGTDGGGEPTETASFRILQGPQNRLARMLDPEGGTSPRFEVAARRLEMCTMGLIDRKHREDLRAVLAHRMPWIREVHMTEDSEVHVAEVTHVLGDRPARSYDSGVHVAGVPQQPEGVRDAKRNQWYGSESKWLRRNLSSCARQALADFNDVDTPLYRLGLQLFKRQAAEARLHFALDPTHSREPATGLPEIALNISYLKNHSWSHHFDGLGLGMTKFMTDGLKCLLTSRAMQCARFLRMDWPDDQDLVMDLDEVKDMIRQAFPWGGAAYLVE